MYVITGGGSGIGQALAWVLAKQDRPVLIVGRHENTLQETAKGYDTIRYVCADVSKDMDRRRLATYLKSQSEIQGLVHNAGTIEPIVPMRSLTLKAWRQCMQTNLEAPLFLTQALWPNFSPSTRILHIGSGAAYHAISGWAAYCTSKAGLAMMTRCWLNEYPHLAIASVMPGIIDTPMQAVIRESTQMNAEKHEFFCRLKTAYRLLSPATVASFLAWLMLDVPQETFVAHEWDIYDNQHHRYWLRPPHIVPSIEA